jgi:hypothetical protein
MIKSRRTMIWAVHARGAGVEKYINLGKSKERDHLEVIEVDRKIVIIDLTTIGWEITEWVYLAYNTEKW